MKRVSIILMISLSLMGCAQVQTQAPNTREFGHADALLKSWENGAAKARITAFVENVTTQGSVDFVPENQRRAFFDMDGTLLCEKPNYIEVVLAEHKLREKLKTDPSMMDRPIYKAVADQDRDYLYEHVKEVITEAFAGETLSAYIDFCRQFLETQTHPRFKRAYGSLFYLPMLELIQYLQGNGFTVYVVSTSQQEFIRSISKDRIGIPPQQIIGTMVGFTLANLKQDAPPVFIRERSYFNPYNADENKVVRMRERALLPAIFAFGNSMGDYAMLDATSDSRLPSLVCILDHDDAAREYEYHKKRLLKEAQLRNWLVVSMKKDFRQLFSGE